MKKKIQVSLLFIIGVVVVSKMFSVTDSGAEGKNQVVHAMVSLNINGDSNLKMIDSNVNYEKIANKGYELMDVVTLVIEDGEVINHYKTEGEELKSIEDKFSFTLKEFREKIFEANFE